MQVCEQKDDCLAVVPSEISEVNQAHPHTMVSGSVKLEKTISILGTGKKGVTSHKGPQPRKLGKIHTLVLFVFPY